TSPNQCLRRAPRRAVAHIPFFGRALTAFEKPKTARSTHPETFAKPAQEEHVHRACSPIRILAQEGYRNPRWLPIGLTQTWAMAGERLRADMDRAGRGTRRTSPPGRRPAHSTIYSWFRCASRCAESWWKFPRLVNGAPGS